MAGPADWGALTMAAAQRPDQAFAGLVTAACGLAASGRPEAAFTLSGHTAAPVEEVWKLLFDPTRFPEWWTGVEIVRTDGPDRYTMWPHGYPDFPMPQSLRTDHDASRIVISSQLSDIDVIWQLAEVGSGTRVEVRVELPDAEAHRLPSQRVAIATALDSLCALANLDIPESTPMRVGVDGLPGQ